VESHKEPVALTLLGLISDGGVVSSLGFSGAFDLASDDATLDHFLELYLGNKPSNISKDHFFA
jgi:hypothetical protein